MGRSAWERHLINWTLTICNLRTKPECKNKHKPRHKGKRDEVQNKITNKNLNLFPREEIVLGFLLFLVDWFHLVLLLLFCFVVVFVLHFVWFVFLFLRYDAEDLIFMFLIRSFIKKYLVKVKKRNLSMTLLVREGMTFKSNVNTWAKEEFSG